MKTNHFKDQTCQTLNCELPKEPIEPLMCEYPCFYCDYMIRSEEHLQRHLSECQERCAMISEKVTNSESAKEPTMNEALKSYLLHYQKMAARKFQCDICLNNFESETLLGMHTVFTHSRLKID